MIVRVSALVVVVEVFVVVFLPFGRVTEGSICVRDADEAFRSFWIFGIAVWMVGFGKGVE